jgi:hypothetical protein
MDIVRRLRGVAGMAVTWGTAFAGLSTTMLVGGLLAGAIPSDVFPLSAVVLSAVRSFVAGGLAGAVFAGVLAGAERRKSLATLSLARVGMWGMLAAVTVPAMAMVLIPGALLVPMKVITASILAYGVLGATLATTVVGIARRAPALPAGAAGTALPADVDA